MEEYKYTYQKDNLKTAKLKHYDGINIVKQDIENISR